MKNSLYSHLLSRHIETERKQFSFGSLSSSHDILIPLGAVSGVGNVTPFNIVSLLRLPIEEHPHRVKIHGTRLYVRESVSKIILASIARFQSNTTAFPYGIGEIGKPGFLLKIYSISELSRYSGICLDKSSRIQLGFSSEIYNQVKQRRDTYSARSQNYGLSRKAILKKMSVNPTPFVLRVFYSLYSQFLVTNDQNLTVLEAYHANGNGSNQLYPFAFIEFLKKNFQEEYDRLRS